MRVRFAAVAGSAGAEQAGGPGLVSYAFVVVR
ncbi:hypothetical protein FHX42_003841 [Saccharopolyspora lacisalsi]|uniref:Uncharacterized protein n=1 Tax=Halosaccharopolyspora lacisalsi TaxID=1000566 RepID=A0A839E3V4_9PSEU|nr:hypothetical protein [Halosaccharopolyspora lacisalsi]